MNGLRKMTTMAIVFAVLFLLRTGWAESSKLGLASSSLMKASFYSSYKDARRHLASDNPTPFLSLSEESIFGRDVLKTKANIKDEKLSESFRLLRGTSSGKTIAEYIDKKGVKVTFGRPKTPGAAAVFIPNFLGNSGSIILSERLKDAEPPVIAAILAHEGTHAKKDWVFGYDSVEQEYQSYVAQAKVWEELGSKNLTGDFAGAITAPSPENEYAAEIMAMEKDEAYNQIQSDYQQIGIDLPIN